ncbi:MAG: hypothetical protein KJO77_04645 [Bacteroidia bacterium]|nr:hypothetical protein [Bacteroidia bacterium]
MSKLQQKSARKTKNLRTPKQQLLVGSLIATFIAITPYLFYLYNSVPEAKVWNTIFFTYESAYFEDVNYVAWMFVGKFIPLTLLLIWFFTNRHWWYHALIVPIAMYIYQLFGLFNDDYVYVDEFQLMHLVPVMAIVVPSIYLIRAQMFNKINSVDKTLEDLEDEFKIKPKSFLDKLSDYF